MKVATLQYDRVPAHQVSEVAECRLAILQLGNSLTLNHCHFAELQYRRTAQASHWVNQAQIFLEPRTGPPGTVVTMTGRNFREFSPVRSLFLGNSEVASDAGTSTDAIGRFVTRFVVPGTQTGLQQVRVTIDGAVAVAAFRVIGSDAAGGATEISQALAALASRLEVVWHFNTTTKEWSFYDGPHGGGLEHLVDGQVYLVQVKEDVALYLNNKLRRFTCRHGNCWNQIIW